MVNTAVTAQQLSNLREKGRTLVTLKERLVYDVTDFLDDHPGGSELITDLAGQDITKVMNDPDLHQHSEAAYVVMQEYLIGQLPLGLNLDGSTYKITNADSDKQACGVPEELTNDMSIASGNLNASNDNERMLIEALHKVTDADKDFAENNFIDLNKPMLMQVLRANWTRDFYIEQVHKPRHYKYGSAPIFGNFLEPLSLTPWWVIPLIWVPANIFVQTIALQGLRWYVHASLYFFGLCLWTLVEYILHRCLFHLDDHLPDNQVAITLHFLMHGVHHYLPMDRMRLVMPPTMMVVLTTPLYHLCHFVFRHYYGSMAIFCGAHMGYVIYDLTHYFLHHKRLPEFFKDTKVWHLDHHYKDYQRGFGVTTRFWDVVFGTQFVDTSKL